jgi:DNA-binding PadR family transcriptional regulator
MATELGIWEIAVLALLREEPMHPYEMQRLLRLRHKDEILALKRGSLYHAIARLQRDQLIAAKSTSRNGRRPERTTYATTALGRKEFTRVLRHIIATPRRESSEFMAAMSFLVHLTPAEALPRLEERSTILEREINCRVEGLAGAAKFVQRINLVESEYLIAMLKAELSWTRSLSNEIARGALSWDLKAVLKEAREHQHPEEQ